MDADARKKYREFVFSAIKNSHLSGTLKDVLADDDTRLAFYGAGMQAQFLLDFCVLTGRNVVCAIDRNADSRTFVRKKIPIFSLKEFSTKFSGENIRVLIAVNGKHAPEIRDALRENNIRDSLFVSDWEIENAEISKITKAIRIFMIENDLLRSVTGVTSLMGGSFKWYLLENSVMREKIAKLREGLDVASLEVLERSFFKILQNPEDWLGRYWLLSEPEYENAFMTEACKLQLKKCRDNVEKYRNDFRLANRGGGGRIYVSSRPVSCG